MNFAGMAIGYADVALQAVLLVLLLLASNYRRYPLLFAYCLVLFATSVSELWSLMHGVTANSPTWSALYWRNEVIVDLLLFFMVITLTGQALEGSPLRTKTMKVLTLISALVVALPFIIFPMRFGPRWFYSTSQLLNFGAAMLNLALWGGLIANHKRDPRLLAVSAGLGVAVTGAAIAYGLGQFMGETARQIIDLFKSATHAASMVIWCWAFLPHAKRESPAARPITLS